MALNFPQKYQKLRMAFVVNGNSVQIDDAEINGIELPWIPDASFSPFELYLKDDSNFYGAADNMMFGYKNFAGESFSSTVDIAPSFGIITLPDTISASKGGFVNYEHKTLPYPLPQPGGEH